MEFDVKRAMGVHPETLRLRGERAAILASNLANVNTPGYQAMDMDIVSHLPGAMSGEWLDFTDTPRTAFRVPSHVGQDGNTVELGVEQAAFAQNAVDFQSSLTFLKIRLQGLALAISGNV